MRVGRASRARIRFVPYARWGRTGPATISRSCLQMSIGESDTTSAPKRIRRHSKGRRRDTRSRSAAKARRLRMMKSVVARRRTAHCWMTGRHFTRGSAASESFTARASAREARRSSLASSQPMESVTRFSWRTAIYSRDQDWRRVKCYDLARADRRFQRLSWDCARSALASHAARTPQSFAVSPARRE